jgi:hypothetical protein
LRASAIVAAPIARASSFFFIDALSLGCWNGFRMLSAALEQSAP